MSHKTFPKPRRVKSEAYRRFVSTHACFACGISGYSQCCHSNGGGMGTKRSDYETFPLCCTRPGHMGCHMMHDLCIEMTLAERRQIEAGYVLRMQRIAREYGWFKDEVAA